LLSKPSPYSWASFDIALLNAGITKNFSQVDEMIPHLSTKREEDSNSPLYNLVWNEDIERADRLIQRGFNVNEVIESRSLLFDAVSLNQSEMVDFLLEAGADPEVSGSGDIASPLATAVWRVFNRDGSLDIVRSLAAYGADPFAQSVEPGSSIYSSVIASKEKHAFPLFKILIGAEDPRFDSCKNVHDVFDLLFLSSKPGNFPSPESLLADFPESADLVDLKDEMRNRHQEGDLWPSYSMISVAKKASLESIKDALLEQNPIFAKAWEIANREKSISLKQTDLKSGTYDPSSHEILIPMHLDVRPAIYKLYEMVSRALLREPLLEALDAASRSREEYAFKMASFHRETKKIAIQIANPEMNLDLVSHYNYMKKEYQRRRAITPKGESVKIFYPREPKEEIGEDHFPLKLYRKDWDLRHSEKFLKMNPDFVESFQH